MHTSEWMPRAFPGPGPCTRGPVTPASGAPALRHALRPASGIPSREENTRTGGRKWTIAPPPACDLLPRRRSRPDNSPASEPGIPRTIPEPGTRFPHPGRKTPAREDESGLKLLPCLRSPPQASVQNQPGTPEHPSTRPTRSPAPSTQHSPPACLPARPHTRLPQRRRTPVSEDECAQKLLPFGRSPPERGGRMDGTGRPGRTRHRGRPLTPRRGTRPTPGDAAAARGPPRAQRAAPRTGRPAPRRSARR